MACIICGKEIESDHKCTESAVKKWERSEAARNGARTTMSTRRYGTGETVGDRIAAGFNFVKYI